MTAIALLGSGEFESWTRPIDQWCAAQSANDSNRVLVLPTASAPEGEDVFARWAAMGIEHYRGLGFDPEVLDLRERTDASREEIVAAIAGARLAFFSGGNPGYLVETLAGTPFWAAVLERFRAGAILAGSSAGAMMLAATTFVPRGRGPDGLPTDVSTRPAMGLVPGVIVAPHFDILPAALRDTWSCVVPAGTRLLGIDEDTALVARDAVWTVRGRGRVYLLGDGEEVAVAPGATLDGLIPAPLAYTQRP